MKKNRMKKFMALILGGSMFLSMVACSNENESIENDRNLIPVEEYIADIVPQGTAVTVSSGEQQYLPVEMYLAFAESEYLNGSIFLADVPAISQTATMIDADSNGGQMKISGAQEGSMPNTKIVGVSNTSALSEFESGERKLIKGRMYRELNECIISEVLAKENGLSIGDVLQFENITPATNGEKIIYNLTISGIYSDSTNEYDFPYPIAYLNRRNEVITSVDNLLGAENASNGSGMFINAIYYLNDSGDIFAFEQQLYDKGMPSGFSVRTLG